MYELRVSCALRIHVCMYGNIVAISVGLLFIVDLTLNNLHWHCCMPAASILALQYQVAKHIPFDTFTAMYIVVRWAARTRNETNRFRIKVLHNMEINTHTHRAQMWNFRECKCVCKIFAACSASICHWFELVWHAKARKFKPFLAIFKISKSVDKQRVFSW